MADEPATPVEPTLTSAEPAPAPSGDSTPPPLTQETAPSTPEAAPVDAVPVIPEKYDFPAIDGKALDQAFVDALTPAFKEAKLTQDQVNILAKTYNEYGAKTEATQEADFKQWMGEQARENDRVIRQEWGAQYDANFKVAAKALGRYFQDQGFYRALEDSGLVRNPVFMRGLLKIGKSIQEDTPLNGSAPAALKPTHEVLYPNTGQAH